jgi:hypothetical protein
VASNRLFPDVEFEEWAELWKRGYDVEYGVNDDEAYSQRMIAVHSAPEHSTRVAALKEFFRWKDRLESRWECKVQGLSEEDWHRVAAGDCVPAIWKQGAVYNVFLWHVATNGRRPLIDQHAWRGYRHLIRRGERCEFPIDRESAVRLYTEYEAWFQSAVAGGFGRRDLDKALMAFGQFCNRFSDVLDRYYGCEAAPRLAPSPSAAALGNS